MDSVDIVARTKKKERNQSAMEYLMTYGWAILIIAIVLASLFELGVFGSVHTGTACIASVGFLCASPTMNTMGYLSINLGQAAGYPINITGVACTTSSSAPASFGSVTLNLASGSQATQVFSCPLTSGMIGSYFTGYLWIKYNTPTQTGLETQIATVTATATTSAGVGAAPSSTSTTTSSTTSTTSSTTSSSSSSSSSSTTTISATYMGGSNTGNTPLTVSVGGGPYTGYICAGAATNASSLAFPGNTATIGTNYGIDAEDANKNSTAVGRGSSPCMVTAANYSNTAVVALGLTGAPSPTINASAQIVGGCGGTTEGLNYTVASTSFVVFAYSCASFYGCMPALPAGCTVQENVSDGNGDEAFVATCPSQSAGTYNTNNAFSLYISPPGPRRACGRVIPGPTGAGFPVSAAVYIYPGYNPT